VYTPEQVVEMNRTARSWTVPPLTYRVFAKVNKNRSSTCQVLDYGSGPKALWSEWLRDQGFQSVISHEIGDNFVDGLHTRQALDYKYAAAIASNVLNVQPTLKAIQEVLRTLYRIADTAYFNFPKDPRKSTASSVELTVLAKNVWPQVTTLDGVYICSKG